MNPRATPVMASLPVAAVPFTYNVAPSAKNAATFQAYKRDAELLAREWAFPGMEGFEHRIGGLEKNTSGTVSHDPENHQKMTDIRKDKIEGIANYIPEGIEVEFQSENGILGMGPFPFAGEEDADLINAGKQTLTARPVAVFVDSATSFAMIR